MRVARLLISVFSGLVLSAAQLTPLDVDGYARMIEAHRGKVVLVDFWATWCEPCREELPRVVALSKKLGFELVTVSADEPKQAGAAAAFLDQAGVGQSRYIKHASDDQVFIDSIDRAWSGALPALFLYDGSGKKVRSFIGDFEFEELSASVRTASRLSHKAKN